jgi:hypothetical protein
MRFLRRACAVAVVATTAACGSETILQPAVVVAPRASAALVPLDPFGIGAKVPGSRGCSAAAYRQFDFWLGKWDVFSQGTQLAGTSVVESELDGCLVEENWTGAFGGRGRSLNTYDASTGTWHQFWVAAGGCPFANIVMEGGIDENGSMIMQGSLYQPLGFLVPPCGPPPPVVVFTRNSVFRWTLLPSGSVLQQVSVANNAPAPVPDPSTGQGLRYDRVAEITPLPGTTGSFCPFRAAAQQFNFMLGTWDVHQGSGEGAQGTATFSKDLTDCLVEEHFAGPGGYEGVSYNTFDVFTQQWLRTFVDNDGQRIYMTGGLQDGKMVLTGTKNGSAGQAIQVRVTWEPAEPTRVVQRWEYSRDGGQTWQAGAEILYTKS